jgi:hypothetical protein
VAKVEVGSKWVMAGNILFYNVVIGKKRECPVGGVVTANCSGMIGNSCIITNVASHGQLLCLENMQSESPMAP